MSNLIPSTLNDILVYIGPGFLVMLAVAFRWFPDRFHSSGEKLGLGELSLLLVLSYMIGTILFRVSSLILYPLAAYFGEGILEGILKDFPNLNLIRSTLQSDLGVKTTGNVDLFRYAAQFVMEKMPQNAQESDRLLTLSLMARTLIFAIPLAGAIALPRVHKLYRTPGSFLLVLLTTMSTMVMLKSFLSYWSSSVWSVLRAYIIYANGEPLP